MFEITIVQGALKGLENIHPEQQKRILQKIEAFFVSNPYPRGKNPKRLKGNAYYRLRAGDYRVIYEIDGDQVIIYQIDNRKDAYR